MKKLVLLLLCAGILPSQAQTVAVTVGTLPNIFLPLNQFRAEGVYEAIYQQSRISQAGTITRLAFDKNDGTDLRSIDGVTIYLKTTPATQLTAGPIDSAGYQRVFKGSFTNGSASGYQEVVLSQPFAYNNVGNLAVLVIRSNGTALAPATNGPRARWRYGTLTTGVSRRYDGGSPLSSSTNLATSNVLANLQLTFGTATGVRTVAPPAGLYPNPATDHATLDAPGWTGPLSYRITDVLGREVHPLTVLGASASGRHPLPLQGLAPGTYHLHLSAGSQRRVLPLVRR